tara:strand:- start:275 stop:463 length:189 start_codon:yes stop_codon:yes gene_type:complete
MSLRGMPIARRVIARGSMNMRTSLRKLWVLLARKENWESRMGWEYFALIFLGSLIAGLGQFL